MKIKNVRKTYKSIRKIESHEEIYGDNKMYFNVQKQRDESKYNIINYFVVISGNNIILKDQK